MRNKYKTLLWLTGVNLFISAFTFGGGYVVVPMIRKHFVDRRRLFTEKELMGMAAVAQSTPGAIAINLSTLAGLKVAGLTGAIVSCVAALVPPLLVLSLVSMFYTAFISSSAVAAVLKGMQAGVAAIIVDLVVDMCSMIVKQRVWYLTALIPLSFAANYILGVNVALVLAISCVICIGKVFVDTRRAP